MKFFAFILCFLSFNAFSTEISCPEGTRDFIESRRDYRESLHGIKERFQNHNVPNEELKSFLKNGMITLVLKRKLFIKSNENKFQRVISRQMRGGKGDRELYGYARLFAMSKLGSSDDNSSLVGWYLKSGSMIEITGADFELLDNGEDRETLTLRTNNHSILEAITFDHNGNLYDQLINFAEEQEYGNGNFGFREPLYLICINNDE